MVKLLLVRFINEKIHRKLFMLQIFSLLHFLFQTSFSVIPKRPPYKHTRQGSNSNGIINPFFEINPLPSTSTANPSVSPQLRNLHSLNATQHQLNAALFSSNPPQYIIQAHGIHNNGRSPKSPRRLNLRSFDQQFEGIELQTTNPNPNRELHMAEKLVEIAAQQNKNAFQFDTMTPKKPSSSLLTESNQECEIIEGNVSENVEAGNSFKILNSIIILNPIKKCSQLNHLL